MEKGNIEGRYSKDYEDTVNPFNHWRDREKAARRAKLSMVDRLTYELGQLVAGSPCDPCYLNVLCCHSCLAVMVLRMLLSGRGQRLAVAHSPISHAVVRKHSCIHSEPYSVPGHGFTTRWALHPEVMIDQLKFNFQEYAPGLLTLCRSACMQIFPE